MAMATAPIRWARLATITLSRRSLRQFIPPLPWPLMFGCTRLAERGRSYRLRAFISAVIGRAFLGFRYIKPKMQVPRFVMVAISSGIIGFTREANAMLLQIPVIYAMELMSAAEMAELPRNVMCTESKARAMRAMLSSFHMAKSAQRGWINVVSIGDSNFERDAAREVAQSRELGRVASKRCFTKTIKMHERPSVSHMNLQLSVISKWFWTLVHVDCNIDIDMGEH